jgi:hypothetical protein
MMLDLRSNKRKMDKLNFIYYLFAVLGFELRASLLLGRCSITRATPPALLMAECHFMFLLTICISSWEKCLFKSISMF